MKATAAGGPLAGVRVLDISSVLSGPLTTQLLADMGAEVIKVENPAAPDFTRTTGNSRGGMTGYFYILNRGKRSLAIDGRHPDGQAILAQLADDADVLVQNMRPGKAAKIGLGVDECLARNPSLIYASISGYGSTGPAAGEPVYDYVIQAVTGMVDLQRDARTGQAELSRHFPADKVTSHAAVEAILAALFTRERDPERRGQHVEVTMHEANLSFFWVDGMMQHLLVGEPDATTVYPGHFYRVYPTTDGDIVLMPLMGPVDGICRAVGHPEWMDDGRWDDFANSDINAFQDQLADAIAPMSSEEALAAFAAEDVPAGAVWAQDDVHLHPQAVARDSILSHHVAPVGEVRVARPPWRFSATPEQLHQSAPTLGRDSEAILAELGFEREEIDGLLAAGVIRSEVDEPLS